MRVQTTYDPKFPLMTGNPRLPKTARARGWRNVMVAAINAGLEQGLADSGRSFF